MKWRDYDELTRQVPTGWEAAARYGGGIVGDLRPSALAVVVGGNMIELPQADRGDQKNLVRFAAGKNLIIFSSSLRSMMRKIFTAVASRRYNTR